jgi:hypothetical protein
MANPVIPLSSLTVETLEGTGVFDVLMRANRAHLENEFQKNRIKGPEYATVYLGSLESVMRTSMEFLLQREKVALEAELMAQQVLIAKAEVEKANAMVLVAQAEVTKIGVELEIMRLNRDKVPFEILHLQAQTRLVDEQVLHTTAQTSHTEAQSNLVGQQTTNLQAEVLNIPKQGSLIDAQAAVQTQQKLNLVSENTKLGSENLHIVSQTALVNQQKLNLVSEDLKTVASTALINQQKSNAVIEATVLTAQKSKLDAETTFTASNNIKTQSENTLVLQKVATEKAQVSTVGVEAGSVIGKQNALAEAQTCKLTAEFNLVTGTTTKTASENTLLLQKVATEKAQITSVGVDDNSVIGKQKALYQAQTNGFTRDAEQKAAKLMVDSWNVRRTTDEGTVADGTNMLADSVVGRAVNKMLSGVGA